jgi:Ala-tRNA(Pro) deacylase
MSVHPGLRELLDRKSATYAVLPAPSSDLSSPAGRSPHTPPRSVSRTVVVRQGPGLSLAVLPESLRLDLPRLSTALRDQVRLAEEREIAAAFPDCEADAVPPIGILYGVKTYVDESLTHERHIIFHAGARSVVIRMPFEEYRRVAAPVVLWLAESMAGA